jgi:hypothetical protein
MRLAFFDWSTTFSVYLPAFIFVTGLPANTSVALPDALSDPVSVPSVFCVELVELEDEDDVLLLLVEEDDEDELELDELPAAVTVNETEAPAKLASRAVYVAPAWKLNGPNGPAGWSMPIPELSRSLLKVTPGPDI